MVGSAMALDLAVQHQVKVMDLSADSLEKITSRNPDIETGILDVTNREELQNAGKGFDLILTAVPGFLGFQTLKDLIPLGTDIVDISFFPENSLELDDLAKEHDITVIVDCGVAPGMDNVILGYHDSQMDVKRFECLVGGLPRERKWPFEYKAPFSPVDVIEEYTRPARYVENGVVVTRPALTDVEQIHFSDVGTLESFNSDGLRSILFTMSHIPDMKEKTLRYPGHVDKIRVLAESGFFDENPITINGKEITPLEFTSGILFREWKLGETEKELTVMRVTVSGSENGNQVTYQYDLHDQFDAESETSSMARTTGYTATAAVNLVLQEKFNKKGVFPPELVGRHDGCFDHFMSYLKDRNVIYTKTVLTS